MSTPGRPLRLAALLLLLAASLTGCATCSPPVQPTLPPVPAELMQPPPNEAWSETVQKLLQEWQQRLTRNAND